MHAWPCDQLNFMLNKFVLVLLSIITCCACGVTRTANQQQPNTYHFDFGGKVSSGATAVSASTYYTENKGYGFEDTSGLQTVNRTTQDVSADGFITGDKPFLFSVKLQEGNYRVTIKVGDVAGSADAAIRVENRRMMVNRVTTANGEIQTLHFAVHVRDSAIKGSKQGVKLKPREKHYLHWDDKLTFEFNGNRPKINSLSIEPADTSVVTMFLAGNSTVVDQAEEPYAAWGQIIPGYFTEEVVVANYAESGESLSSFIAGRRLNKMLSLIKAGDYAFVEFGHNDQKQSGPGIGAFTSYTNNLKIFITEVRKKGGNPVLVTSMQRRSFDSLGKIIHTLGDYPEAVRRVAKEENVPLIDLNRVSKIMYEAWGPQESLKAFVHFPANTFPNQKADLKDNTHFTPFGASQIAKIIIEGIRQNVPALAKHIKPDMPKFNAAAPDNFGAFYWPVSLLVNTSKPDGN